MLGERSVSDSDESKKNEAVTVMSALNLLKGYEDGTFGPDKTITRAEFAAVVVRMLGMEDAAAGAATATNFTDVPATHWAAGYVKIANQKGIIAGYGDGTFGPDDEVTYEQAIKMLVCALGYAMLPATLGSRYYYYHYCAQSLSQVQLFTTPWTVAQVPLSMDFSMQE